MKSLDGKIQLSSNLNSPAMTSIEKELAELRGQEVYLTLIACRWYSRLKQSYGQSKAEKQFDVDISLIIT